MVDEESEMDLRHASALLEGGETLRERLEPDPRILCGSWGLAWLVGYGALWISARAEGDATPSNGAFVVFVALLIAATVMTAVHTARRASGLRGASATTGAMYGWSWAATFSAVGLVVGSPSRFDLPREVYAAIANVIPPLLVGALYMAGAATYRNWSWFFLGAWIVVVAAFATMLAMPITYLAMAVAGGLVMLAVAGFAQLKRSQSW